MKNSEKFEAAFSYFRVNYKAKMGGTQTVVLPNGKSKFFDDREYYSGRGAKFNKSINHHYVGDVKVSKAEYTDFLNSLKEREVAIKARKVAALAKSERIENAKINGIYSINTEGYVELSDEEIFGKYFDTERLANTLKISISDVELLKSNGKTYVFAQSESGATYELYHPSLSCNDLSIYVGVASEERIDHFVNNRSEWVNAPYAAFLGQTNNENHFVC